MKAIFRDELGYKLFDNIANVQYYRDGIWSIMYTDFEIEEVRGELIEVDNQEK